MGSNRIYVKIYADGDPIGDVSYDQDVIKIGRLKSSHLHLDGDGVSRMHAVIERSPTGYHLLDLNSVRGCSLNGTRINKSTPLPKKGTLAIGSFKIEFELDEGPETVDIPSIASKHVSFDNAIGDVEKLLGESHHRALYSSLLDELERLESASVTEARKMLAIWPRFEDDRKRKVLRLLIKEIRSCRLANKLLQRKRVATMLNLGMEGMEAIYRLDPETALEKAHETIMDMAISKSALDMLTAMGLDMNIEKAFKELPPHEQDKQRKDVEGFVEVHAKLADRLQTSIVAGASLIPAYLFRAGGREASDEDRFQWKAAFDQIKAAQKEPKMEVSANDPN